MENPFDDLIPKTGATETAPEPNLFADLIPQQNPFEDLIPKIGTGEGEPELRPMKPPGVIRRLARGARRALDPMIGPSEADKLENAVLLKQPDGTIQPEYKPLGDALERHGVLNRPSRMAEDIARAEPGAPAVEKVARGVARGAVGALDALFPLAMLLGPFAQGAPLLHRTVSGAFGAHMLSSLPDVIGTLNEAVKSKDWETTSEALTATGLMGYFGYRGLKEATKPGLAMESPKLREILTKKVTEEYTPQQVREIYLRVNRGEATPAEAEFVRFLNAELESPGQAVRQGVKFESTEPRIQNEKLRQWLGLDDATARTLIFPSRAATARDPIAPEQPITPTPGEQDATIRQRGPAEVFTREQTGVSRGVGQEIPIPPTIAGTAAPQAPTQKATAQIEQGQAIEAAAAATNPDPTEAQKEAGNYAKGRVNIQGINVVIETPRGVERTGKDKAGNEWRVAMPTHYGYISKTEGKDGDAVDVYIGPDAASQTVFVIDQIDADTGKFDEHKALIGYVDPGAAITDYNKAFSDGRGIARIGAMSAMTMGEFQEWLKGDTTKPLRLGKAGEINAKEEKEGQAQPGVLTAPTPPAAPAAYEAGFEPEGAMFPVDQLVLDAFMKDVPPALLEKRTQLLEKARGDIISLDQFHTVEAVISALDGKWTLQGFDEALRYATKYGSGAVEFLQKVAASGENTKLVDRAKQILERLPTDRGTKVVLEKGVQATPYDDILFSEAGSTRWGYHKSQGSDVLSAVIERTQDPALKDTANLLLERGVNPKVIAFRTGDQASRYYRNIRHKMGYSIAWYDPATDTIIVNGVDPWRTWRTLESVLVHELVHAASMHVLHADTQLDNTVWAFTYAAYDELDRLPKNIQFARVYYSARDPFELVAEAFTNPEVREWLSGVMVPETYGTGARTSRKQVSLLDRILTVMEPLLSPPTDPATKATPAAVVASTPEAGRRGLIRSETEGQLDFERATQNAQVSTLLDLLEKYGTSPANPLLQVLGYDELAAIQQATQSARLRYEDFKAANPDAAYIPAVALEASLKLILERDKWKKIRERLAEQEALIKSKDFQRKIERMEAKTIQKEALDTAWDNFRASLKDAIEEAKRGLQAEGGNEGRAEMLLRSIASLESVQGYQAAIEHALEAMVNALAQNPDMAQFLAQANPTAQGILAEYNRIRAQLGQDVPASDIVLEWSGELLARSWQEAQRMILSAMVRDNLKLQKDMTAYERAIFRGLRDKPRATVDEILKEARKNSKATALTQLAWGKLRREVSRELEEWDHLQQAVSILDQVEGDAEYKAHANAVFKDAKIEDRPGAVVRVGNKNVTLRDLNYDAIAGSPIFPMPDGSVVQVDLVGDAKAFDVERKKMEDALDKLRDWKEQQDALPASQRDPSYNFFVGHMRALEGIYLSTRVTHPSSLVSVGNPFSGEQPGAWDMPTFLLDDLGTRVGGAAKVAASNFNRVHALARNLLVRQHELANAQYAAANSYKFKGSQNERALQLYDHVLQPLFAAAQRPGFKLQVGMVVGEGYAVTKEVVALLKLQRELAEQAFKIVQERVPTERPTSAFPPVIKDQINGVLFHGQSLAVNETTLPFGGWNERATSFVEDYIAKKRRGDVDAAVAELARNYDFIFSYLADRASIVELGPSPYENAYQLLVNRLRATPPTSAQRNLRWIAEQIAGINGAEPREVAQTMAGELDAMIEHVASMRQMEEESDPTVSVSQPHQATSFTARRHDRSVPYYFVRYGFRTGANFLDFIGNTHAHAFERFIESLGEVQRDLERQRDELSVRYDQRLQELLTGGTPEPKAKRKALKQVKLENALAHLNGETTDQFRSLEKRLHQVRKTIQAQKDIFTGNREAEMDITTWRKISRAAVGSLLTPATVLIRNGTGLAYIGSAMARMRRNAATSSVDVAARLVLDGLLRQGVAVPVFKAMKYALGRGGLKPWFETLLSRLDRNQRLEEAGLVSPIDVLQEFAAKLRNLENAGIVLDDKRGVGERTILSLLGIFDSFLLTAVAKPLFPRLGDQVINATSDSATVAMVKELEKRLRELLKTWTEAGRIDSRFDFANPTSEKNVFAHDEIFPAAVFDTSSRQKLEYLRQQFEWSGTTFDRAAFDFLQKLRSGDPNAELLNPEQMVGLKDQILGQVNVPHALNRPAWTHQRDIFHSLFAPLVGWNIHALRQFVRYFSRPGVAPGESRMAMWMVMGLVLLPILLAMTTAQDMGTEEIIRLFYRAIGKERSTRQVWEQPPDRVAMGLLISALNPVPYVSMAVNTALNDSPTRASFDPTPVIINKIKDVLTYAGGVVQTGNPQYGLERMISSVAPMVAPLLTQLPSQEGVQDALNARRLLTRHGDPDLLRPRYTGSGPATPLTPFGQKMLNAAMTGDDAAFQEAYDAAVAEARAMGKPNPEATVKAIFQAQNPYGRAFKAKLSPEQRDELLAKLDPRERAIVERAEQRFSHAGSLIGVEPTFERQPSRGGFGTLGGNFALGRSRGIRRGRSARRGRRTRLSRGRSRSSRVRRSGMRRLSRGLRLRY